MAKNLFGGAIINSGPDLPSPSTSLDGSLFLKTGSAAGLYFFGFDPDTNIALGQQSSRDWSLVAAIGGVDLSDYVQKAGSTVTGQLVMTAASGSAIKVESAAPAIHFYEQGQPLNAKGWSFLADAQEMQIVTLDDAGSPIAQVLSVTRGGTLKINGVSVSFGGAPNVSGATGVLPVANGGTGQSSALAPGGVIFAASGSLMASSASGTAGQVLLSNGTASPTWSFSAPGLSVGSASTATNASFAASATTAGTAATANNSNLLNGLASSTNILTNNIVARDINGHIYANYFFTNATLNDATAASQIAFTSGDGAIRLGSLSQIATALGAVETTHTGVKVFRSTQNTSFDAASSNLQVEAASSGAGATISFHRPGFGAMNMGLDSDNVFRIGGWSSTDALFNMTLTGDVGIVGNFTAGGNVTAFSDRRLKTDISSISDPLEKLMGLNGICYTRKGTNLRGTGLIAQDVQKVMPEAVIQNEEGYLSVAYGNLVGLLVEVIKTQQQQLDALERRIDSLAK